jgi:hypothetical protein
MRYLLLFLLTTSKILSQNNPPSKKGVAFSLSYESSWQERFDKLNPSWHYSWNWEYRSGYPNSVEFVPMIWGRQSATQEKMDYLNNLESMGVIENVLAFNEPDLEGQANLTVDEAVDLWPLLETLNGPISSPVTSAPLNDWMRNFMNKAIDENLRIDFVAIHIYHKNTPSNFLALVEEVYETYGKPIWITEFAVRDNNASESTPNKYSEAYVHSFMNEVLNALEQLEYVKRYSWFDPSSNNSKYPRLETADLISENNQLTTLGDFYANYSLSLQNNNTSNIYLSPSPASNTIKINENKEELKVTVYDVNGQVQLKKKIIDKLDVTPLTNGVYFLKLGSGENETIHKTVIQK